MSKPGIQPDSPPGTALDAILADWPPAEKTRSLSHPLWTIVLLAWVVRFFAVLNLVSSFLHNKPAFIQWLGLWSPFEIAEGRHIRMFLMAVLLFILASGLLRGKRMAWLGTIVVLVIAPLLHLGGTVIGPQVVINLALIGFLLFHHRHFVARSDQQSVRLALVTCSLLALALLIFGTIRLHDLRFETSGGDDWWSCMQAAFELVITQNSETQQPQTMLADEFFAVLRTGGTLIAVFGLILTLRPVLLRRWIQGEHREKARQLIHLHGYDPFDPFALLTDKSYFFTADGKAVVPYAFSSGFAVALGDPIGPPAQRSRAIAEFALFCRHQDWEPVFCQVTDELFPSYEQAGFSMFKIGEEARLQADAFILKGNDFQNLRTARNRAHKLGITFRWYFADRGIEETLEKQLAEISQRWLHHKKAREMSFDMGAFNLEDLRRSSVAIAINSAGIPLAFALWRPFAQGNGQTLDLMRSLPNERNIMDFVLVESILYFCSQGINDISLGNAPLANLEKEPSRLLAEEKVVQFLFENLNRLYGYKSLFEFKRKYRPQWRGRYVAYRRGVQLPLVGLALVRIHAPEGLWKFLFDRPPPTP
jgi:lysylphosphatidylglycerol synthetase-like protein (DUF2156 family)